MKYKGWTKEQLIKELKELQARISELEKSENEQKQAKEALQKSKEMYKALVKTSPDSVTVTDLDGNITYVSKQTLEMHGFESAEELIGKSAFEFIAPEDREKAMINLQRTLKEGIVKNIVYNLLRKDGTRFIGELNADLIKDPHGKPKAFIADTRDITKRTHLEEKLKESEKKYSTLVEKGNDGIIIVSDGLLRFVNSKMMEITGVSIEEALGKPFIDFVSLEYRESVIERYNELTSGKEVPDRYEIEILSKDGSKIPVEINCSIIEHEGKPADIAIVRDITERKRAEEALQESEKKYRYLFKHGQNINILLGLDRKIIEINESAANALGYDKGEVIGKDALEFVVPEHKKKAVETLAKDFRCEYTPSIEFNIIAKQGVRTFLFSEGHASLFEKGKQIGILLSAVDITERKRVEKMLQETNEHLKYLLASISAAIYTSKTSGDYGATTITENVKQMMGYEPREFIENSSFWIDHVHPEDRQRILNEQQYLFEQGTYIYEYRFLHKDGTYRWIRDEMKLMKDKAGNPIEIVGYWIDTTERKKTEELQKKLHHSVKERVKELSCLYKVSKLFAESDKPLEEVFQEVADLIPPAFQYPEITCARIIFEGRKFTTANFNEAKWKLSADIIVSGKKPGYLEVYYLEEKPAIDEGPFLKEEKNIINSIVRHLGNTIERRHADELLKESKEFTENIIASMKDGFSIVDSHGVHLDVNRALCKMTGFTREELIGTGPPHPYWPKEKHGEIEAAFQKTFRGKFEDFESIFKRKNGERFPVIVSPSSVKDKKGNVISYFEVIKDITERKKIEEQIRYQANLVDSVSDSIISSDLNFNIMSWNKAAEDIYGWKADEVIGKPLVDVTKLEYPHDRMEEVVKQLFEKGEWKGEVVQKRKDGASLYILASVSLIRDSAGNPIGVVTINRDITERKKVEDALQESKDRYQNIFHIAPVSIWEEDLSEVKSAIDDLKSQGVKDFRKYMDEHPEFVRNAAKMIKISDVNDATLKMYGIKNKEYLIGSLDKVFERESFPVFKEELIAIAEGKTYFESEAVNQTSQGERINVLMTLAIPSETAEFKKLLVSITDITDRKKAEDALKESEEKFRNLAEQSPNMIFINKKGRLLYVNKKCEDVMKYKREEFYSSDFDFLNLIAPEYLEVVNVNYRKHIKGEEVSPYECALITKEDKRLESIITTKLIMYGGDIAIIGIVTDITERKHAEKNLIKTARALARSNVEMETFVYSVAHDLRSPLRAMRGFSDALLEDYADKMDAAAQDHAKRIAAAAKRMDILISGLLEYNSISSKELEFAPVSLESVVADVLVHWEKQIQEKEAQVTVEKPLPEVICHSATLVQAIENLLSNAVTFVAPGIKPQVRIWADERDEWVRLWVEDNGIGIAPKYHERIFRIFERLHSIDEYPGTGIGLAIVSKGVERMGGKVGVESALGKGSKFWIELPKVKKKT